MKKNQIVKTFLTLTGALLLAACGSTNAAETSEESSKEKIVIATSGAPKPFTYVNENDELVGYDIELVEAVFEKIDKYDISFEKAERASVLSGLDTDRYQVGANNFASNDERREKYIFSDAIYKNQYVIAVAEESTEINNFNDLVGKSTEVSPGLNYATALEKYNEENPDALIDINYSEAELLVVLQGVESGKHDFQLIDKAMASLFIEEHGLKLKLIELSEEDSSRIGAPYSYLLISKTDDGAALVEEINAALKEAIEDGTITEISEKYFGEDFAPKE